VRPQQIPHRFQGVDMHFTPGVLLPPMLDCLVAVAQAEQKAVDLEFR